MLGKYIDEDLLMSMMQSNSSDSIMQNAFSLVIATAEKTMGSHGRDFFLSGVLGQLKGDGQSIDGALVLNPMLISEI